MKKVVLAVLVLQIGSSNPSSAQFNEYGPYDDRSAESTYASSTQFRW